MPITVRVTDQGDRPSAGVSVTFVASPGDGTFAAATAITDASGEASSIWTLGTAPGAHEATVSHSAPSAPSAPGPNVTVSATAAAGPAVTMTLSVTSAIIGIDPGVDRRTITIAGTDAFGNVSTPSAITWQSSAPTVASVVNGVVRGIQPGAVRITATSDTVSATVDLVVRRQTNVSCVAPPPPSVGALRGAPTFAMSAADILQQYPNSIPAVLDLNGDGRADVLHANSNWASGVTVYDGYVDAWVNRGDGRFDEATTSRISGTARMAEFPMRPIIADFNRDGQRDVYFAQTGFERGDCALPGFCEGARDLLYLSQPGGTWHEVSATSLAPADQNAFTHTAAAADVDCDGDADLFLGRWGNARATAPARLMLNQGGGTFIAAPSTQIPGLASLGWAGSALCDVDRDGDPDLIRTSARDGRQRLFVNNGFGALHSAAQDLPTPFLGADSEVGPVVCLDYNLDGWPDIVVSEINSANTQRAVRLLRNNGDLTFTDVSEGRLSITGLNSAVFSIQWMSRLEVGDLNGDGWPDLVGSGLSARHIWINNGDGFTLSAGDDQDYNTISVMGDFDGDGRLDLLQTNNINDTRRGPAWLLWRNTSP